MPASPSQSTAPSLALRRGIAAASCAAASLSFLWFFVEDHSVPFALLLPLGLLLASAGLLYRDHLPSQILVRAALWSNLILGTLIAISGGNSEVEIGAVMAVATATGLLSLGRSGLDARTEAFAPVAFRGSLVLALVMALADTQSLALFGTIQLENGSGLPILACAALMGVALFGLYRLRVWGLALNIVANVLIASLALTDVLDLPPPIVFALCSTAAVQLALPAPLLVAMIRGKAPEDRVTFARLRATVVPVATVALASLAVAGWLVPGRLVSF